MAGRAAGRRAPPPAPGRPPPTGAVLGYDSEGQLASWRNAPSSPATTDSFLYDGEGQRDAQSVTVNGSITTTTTYVASGLEEIKTDQNGTPCWPPSRMTVWACR